MILGILKELETENRVAMLPGEVAILRKLGVEVIIEKNAGVRAFASDNSYVSSGAVTDGRQEVISGSDFLLSVNPPLHDNPDSFRHRQVLCSVLNPALNAGWIEAARKRKLTLIGLDLIPRISRAQSMDVLSSMATIAGYRAVLEAASRLPKFFPMFMSAAGTIKPAKVLILGAGVAGLQAVAVARKLGAVVEVFDVRSAVREEVKSLGAKFVGVEGAKEDSSAGGYAVEQSDDFKNKQQELIQQRAAASDVVICTAQIPGKKAPVLLLKETVAAMKPGSVIIDLAASSGGNCELTSPGNNIVAHEIKIIGKTNYPSEMASDASKMFGNNVISLLRILISREGQLVLNMDDEIVRGTVAVLDGEYVGDRIKQLMNIK